MSNITATRRNAVRPLFEAVEARQMMSIASVSPHVNPFAGTTLSSSDLGGSDVAVSADHRDNSQSGANGMGKITTVKAKTGTITGDDTVDFFSFKVGKSAKMKVTLSGLSNDADLTIFDKSGNEIGHSNNSGTAGESFTKKLKKGTYFASVNGYDQQATDYRLSVRVVTPAPAQPVQPPAQPVIPSDGRTGTGIDPTDRTTLIERNGSFSNYGDSYTQQITLYSTVTIRVDFDANYQADLMIVDNATDRNSFTSGGAANGYSIFHNQNGYQTVTLSAGDYWVVTRNNTEGSNNWAWSVTQI